VDLDTIEAAAEIPDQAERKVAYPRSDIEHAMLGSQAARDKFRAAEFTRPRESLWVPRPVVIDAEVRRRQYRIGVPMRDAIDECREAIESTPCATGKSSPSRSL
jgi:hypothetical protein